MVRTAVSAQSRQMVAVPRVPIDRPSAKLAGALRARDDASMSSDPPPFRRDLLTEREAQLLSFVVIALFEANMNARGGLLSALQGGVRVDVPDEYRVSLCELLTGMLRRCLPDLDPWVGVDRSRLV